MSEASHVASILSWAGPSILISLLILALIYLSTLSIYRLFFHPLAQFPGPRLAAITRYYEAYHDIIRNGQYTFEISRLHAKYGPIIRISPYELHVSDSSFFEKLYRQDGRWNKYAWSYDAFSAPLSSICTVEHDVHRRRRAAMNTFFSKATVAKRQGVIKARLERLCARIQDYDGSEHVLNLGIAISAFTGDVATEYITGKSYDNLGRSDFNESMTSVLRASGAIWRVTKHVRFLGPVMHKMPALVRNLLADAKSKAFFAFITEVKRTTRDIVSSPPSKQPDSTHTDATLIHTILQSPLPASENSYGRLIDEISTVLGAALETTAQTLRLILYHIYTDRTILDRLRAELSHAAQHSEAQQEELPLKMLEQLPYLTAVLTEGLRLSPGLATRMARIAPDRDLVYDKWVIPAGTPVGMTTFLLHVDERAYPEPHLFEPGRWLDGGAKRMGSDGVFAPFSRGTRNCLGMHLAWAELYMTVAALVGRFDFTFVDAGPKDVVCVSDQFIVGTGDSSGLKVYVSSVER